MKKGLIIFIRNPIVGKVKTRLAQTMGNANALLIYEQLLLHTHQITKDLSCDKFLYYSDWAAPNDLWENDLFQKKVQSPGDLGERMSNAFASLFNEGYDQLLIIGSDCLELNEPLINKAFDALNNHEVVMGPSADGGYYLLGMSCWLPQLFQHKKWGCSSVLNDTLQDVAVNDTKMAMLVMLNDIDEEKDVPVCLLRLIKPTPQKN